MHCLSGCYLDLAPESSQPVFDQSLNITLYPLKVMVPPKFDLVLNFEAAATRHTWIENLQIVIDCKSVHETYKFGEVLGKGQFGLVR